MIVPSAKTTLALPLCLLSPPETQLGACLSLRSLVQIAGQGLGGGWAGAGLGEGEGVAG